MNINPSVVRQHARSFDEHYEGREDLANTSALLRYPLRDIENYDWQRGPYANPYYAYMYRRFTAHIYESAEIPRQKCRVFILGCGQGLDERNIATTNPSADLWSVDISEVMLGEAVKSGTSSHMARASAEFLPFPSNCFDRVLSREVIEHVMDPERMLCEVSRVLKPGGIAVITTENEDSWTPGNRKYNKYRSFVHRLLFLGKINGASKITDCAPTNAEFGRYADEAHLEIVGILRDGAVYNFLARLQWILKSKRLLALGHFLSRLENNRYFAPRFCDQVKYIFKKPEDPGAKINDAGFTALGGGTLRKTSEGYICKDSGDEYKFLMSRIPDFLGISEKSDAANMKNESSMDEKSAPVQIKSACFRIRLAMAKGMLAAYAIIYMLVAILLALLCPANSIKRPSRHLKRNSKFQNMMGKSLTSSAN